MKKSDKKSDKKALKRQTASQKNNYDNNKKDNNLSNDNILAFSDADEHIYNTDVNENSDNPVETENESELKSNVAYADVSELLEKSDELQHIKNSKMKKQKAFLKNREIREQKKIDAKLARKKHNKVYTAFVILSVIVLLLIFLLYSNSKKQIMRGDGEAIDVASFEIDTAGNYSYSSYKDGVLAVNGESIKYYNSELVEQWAQTGSNGTPVIDVSGNSALICYNNTHDAYMVSGKTATRIEMNGNVIGGDINENGSCAIIATEDGYKAQIAVFDKNGGELYRWHSAENYITDVDLSEDGDSMIVSTLDFSEGSSSGGLMFFNFSQEKPYAGFVLDGNVVVDVKYLSKSRIAAIGDQKTAVYNLKGEVVNEISYENMKLITYDTDENGSMAFAYSHDDSIMSNCDVVLYNDDGKETGRYTTKGKVKNISMTSQKALLVLDREFVLLSDSAKEISKVSENKDIRTALLLGNAKNAFIVSGTSAQLVKIN